MRGRTLMGGGFGSGRRRARFSHVLAVIVGFSLSLAASAQPRTDAFELTDPGAIMSAAYEASRDDCASPVARALFRRAAELGAPYAEIDYARSFDPLFCDSPGADAGEAARLYAVMAERAGSGSIEAVTNWAKLVEQGRASAAPFAGRTELLSHYGRALLSVSTGDEVLAMLQTAAADGDAAALSTLSAASDFATYRAPSGHWSEYDSQRASCVLGRALIARRGDGERDGAIMSRLRDCAGHYEFLAFMAERIRAGRATTAEKLETAGLIGRDSNLFGDNDLNALMMETLEALAGGPLSREESGEVAALIYDVAARRYTAGELAWADMEAQFERALAVDRSSDRETRSADRYYQVARRAAPRYGAETGDEREEADAERRQRRAALQRAGAVYLAHRAALEPDRLRRLVELAWHGFGANDRDRGPVLEDLMARLARAGDGAARNTLALIELDRRALDYRYDVDAYLDSVEPDVCDAGDLGPALEAQTTLYQRLSQMRRIPSVSGEISSAARAAIAPGGAVALFHRDLLKSCVWIVSAGGRVEFGEIYAPPPAIDRHLREFFAASGVDAGQSSRAPRLRAASTGIAAGGASGLINADEQASARALRTLATILFPGALLDERSDLERLVIVPYGSIGNVPFDALPLDARGDPFIARFSTTISPSAIDLFAPFADAQLGGRGREGEGYVRIVPGCEAEEARQGSRPLSRAPRPPGFTAPLIVGDPDYDDAEFQLPQLSGARTEAENVARLLGAEALIGEAATRDAIAERARSADLLYFATHGVSFSENGLGGFVALAGGGRWNAREVQSACLVRAALAVLSACQTGLGQNVSGGVIGLARAFQIAGVDNVVMSLWNVSDQATSAMMLDFMGRIRSGEDPAEALRQAKLHVRAQPQYSGARYWASFTLFSAYQPAVVIYPADPGGGR